MSTPRLSFLFFFQAEDGIRDADVTGVQTCALPIFELRDPVALEVEQQLGFTNKHDIERYGIAEFNQRCRESVFEFLEEWDALTQRIGFWLDLEHAYRTLDRDYIESVWWALRRIWDEELLYEANR